MPGVGRWPASVDVDLSKRWEIMEDRGASSLWGLNESDTTWQPKDNNNFVLLFFGEMLSGWHYQGARQSILLLVHGWAFKKAVWVVCGSLKTFGVYLPSSGQAVFCVVSVIRIAGRAPPPSLPSPHENRGPLGAEMGLSCSLLYWGAVSLVVSPWPFVPLLSAWAILPTSRRQYHLLKRFSHFPGHQNHLELVSTQLWRPSPINSHSLGLGAPRCLLYPLTTLTPPSLPTPPHTFESKKCYCPAFMEVALKITHLIKLMVNKHLEWMRVLLLFIQG